MPFLDVRLVETLLQVPWTDRIPFGDFRRIGRDALGPSLPQEFALRTDQGSWAPVWAKAASHFFGPTSELMNDGVWLSAPYVDLGEARRMMREAESAPESDFGRSVLVAEFGLLEAWLRRIFQYDAGPREVEICLTR